MAEGLSELERVLTLAEWSESSDALLLAAEVRRLSNIEEAMKSLAEDKRAQAAKIWAAYEHLNMSGGYVYAADARRNAERLTEGAEEIERALGLGG